MGQNSAGDDDLAVVLRQSRDQFVSAFPATCDEIRAGLAAFAVALTPSPALQFVVHRLTGRGGTVGFPTVSQRSAELERLLASPTADARQGLALLDAIRSAFAADAREPPVWAVISSRADATGRTVLIVDDDDEQRNVMTRALEQAGFTVVSLKAADTIIETARRVQPAVVVLDVIMPGISGHLACHLLKTDPEVGDVPVMFVSTQAAFDERLAGLALGAVDYLTKPVDLVELVFRVRLAARRTEATPSAQHDATLSYADFRRAASDVLPLSAATLVLLRVDAVAQERLLLTLVAESRRRDLIGRFDRLHLVLLVPQLPAAAVAGRLRPLLKQLQDQGIEARAGLATSPSPGARTLDALEREADESLANARYHGESVLGRDDQAMISEKAAAGELILLADDDPEVMRIVDTQLRNLQFATTIAFDGETALAALMSKPVRLVVLDLMLPKLTGFELLHRLRDLPEPHPRVLVLSARSREEDLMRAFQLGADDYVTKPFRPQELAARVVRLLR